MNIQHVKSLALAGAVLTSAGGALALEVDPPVLPEINIGGRAVATVNMFNKDQIAGGDDDGTEFEIADSSLLLGFAKHLYNDVDFGFANIGIKLPEDDSDLRDDIFIHELNLGVGAPSWEAKLGRSRLPNTLIQFPTVRDDDLLDYTHVLNGSSNAEAEEDVIYGGLLAGRYFLTDSRVALSAALTARTETRATALSDTDRQARFNLNGLSVGAAYDVPEDLKFDRGLRFAGITVDAQRVENTNGIGKTNIAALIAGATYNLSENPEQSWAVDAQAIYSFGDSVPSLAGHLFRARAESVAVVGAVRYASRPFLQTRWQAALTVAYKDYTDFDDAGSFALAPSFAWRLGSGVELVAQYRYRVNGDRLAADTGLDSDHTILIGGTFAFDYTLNESVSQRGSILSLEHDMLDIGPIGGGH